MNSDFEADADQKPQVVETDLVLLDQFNRQPLDKSVLRPYEFVFSQVSTPSIVKNFDGRRPESKGF